MKPREFDALLKTALREDGAASDLTSRRVLPNRAMARARIVARANGVLAGGEVAARVFRVLNPSLRCRVRRRDGVPVRRGQVLLTVEGRAASILAAERTALNLLGHLSGIATLTAAYVRRAQGTRVKIFDTRKTLPGLRVLQKYAVHAGGGCSHRASLRDAVLIKTNHLRVLEGRELGIRNVEFGMVIQRAIKQAKGRRPRNFVEVEVRNLKECQAALAARPDAILLDNWRLKHIRRAVWLRNSAFRIPHSALLLEVSGGVTLANIRAIARTGVERISVGRLTHSAPALDVALEVIG